MHKIIRYLNLIPPPILQFPRIKIKTEIGKEKIYKNYAINKIFGNYEGESILST
jgi:hypothetical protein